MVRKGTPKRLVNHVRRMAEMEAKIAGATEVVWGGASSGPLRAKAAMV